MSAPTLVQYNDANGVTDIAFLSNVTAGNFLLCFLEFASVSEDSLGNGWALLESDGLSDINVYYCPASQATGANTVNFGGPTSGYVAIAEFTPCLLQSYTALTDASLTSADLAGAANQLLVGYALGAAASAITGAGAGFTYESVNEPGRIAMEYQALSGAGSVSSVFTGTAAHVITGAIILSEQVTPLSETPSLVQASAPFFGPFANDVTAGNTLIAYTFSDVSSPSISDTLNNSWTLIAAVSAPIFGGSETGRLSAWICENCKGGVDTVDASFAMEFTPSVATASSAIATGVPSGDVVSASISALAAQLLVGYGIMWGGVFASAAPNYQGIGSSFLHGIAAETQPVTSNGSFTSDFTWVPALGGSNYMTGVLALQSAYVISGAVSGTSGYVATVSYTGPSSGTVSVDGSGNYTIPGLVNGAYTITPSCGSFVFTPSDSVQTVAGANITGVDFATYTISGTTGVPGAVVSYSGTASGNVIAGSGGAYSIPGLAPGTGSITPSLAGYTFSPTSHSETITTANITGVNFTPTQTVVPTTRFTFIQRQSTTPGATTYDVMDGSSTNTLGRTISGSGSKVGTLFWDNIITQAWSFNLQDNQPYIVAGSSDALGIEYFAVTLPTPAGVTTVQPSNTPSTRFSFSAVTRRSGSPVLQYLVSDGPTQSFGSVAQIIWDGVFDRWAFLQTNASSEIASPNDVASITTFASSLALIAPNQISL